MPKKYTTRITSKGQVTIPKAIRERFNLVEGDYLVFEARGNQVVARKAEVTPTADFEALADRIAKRFARSGISRSDVAEAIRWARKSS